MSDASTTPGAGGARYADDAARYRLDSHIATGGMGEVWRATDTVLDREVAVKLLKPEYADDATFRSRFETEARHAASLHHPGIAGVFDFGESRGGETASGPLPRPYLVMELVDGRPLSALVRPGQPLAADAVRDLLAQAGDAIGAAHRAGIVHRDVKPANLLVTPDRRVKVTDFGIARAVDAVAGTAVTSTGQVMGTPQYLSPEQARGEAVTPASDVYALGVVAFECLAGRRPFEAASPVATALAHLQQPVPELPSDVPADLAAVVRRALAKDPAARFSDAAAFAAALRDPAAAPVAGATAATEVVGAASPEVTQVLPGADPAPAAPSVTPSVTPPGPPRGPGPAPGGATAAPRRGGRGRTIGLVLAVLALVVLGVAAALALTGGNEEAPPAQRPEPTRSSRTATADRTVEIDESDYLGRPVDQVVADLEGLGLDTDTQQADNPGDQQPGVVTGVSPTGALQPGTLVTVSYWGERPPAPPPSQPTQTQSPAPTSAPTSAPTATATTPGAPSSSAAAPSTPPTTAPASPAASRAAPSRQEGQ